MGRRAKQRLVGQLLATELRTRCESHLDSDLLVGAVECLDEAA